MSAYPSLEEWKKEHPGPYSKIHICSEDGISIDDVKLLQLTGIYPKPGSKSGTLIVQSEKLIETKALIVRYLMPFSLQKKEWMMKYTGPYFSQTVPVGHPLEFESWVFKIAELERYPPISELMIPEKYKDKISNYLEPKK